MPKSMYTIMDEKAQAIGPIFMAASDAEAQRNVSLAIEQNTIMSRYPADFALMRIGDIDCRTAGIIVPEVPCIVCKLDELLPPKEK